MTITAKKKISLTLSSKLDSCNRQHRIDVDDLVGLFNECFVKTERTELCHGAEEPIYLPSDDQCSLARVVSTLDYFSSALHEVSHWCIAGEKRRTLIDYGYWYEPDGRDEATQALFEKVEVKPQALEWIFSKACGVNFRLSVDNVALPELKPSAFFIDAVTQQANRYLEQGMPARGRVFMEALVAFYGTQESFSQKPLFAASMLD
jgi:elongation factor P hydroxylase